MKDKNNIQREIQEEQQKLKAINTEIKEINMKLASGIRGEKYTNLLNKQIEKQKKKEEIKHNILALREDLTYGKS